MNLFPVCHLQDVDLTNQTVLVRIDGNVPFTRTHSIADDSRLKASLATLELIKNKGGRSVLLTHLGDPETDTTLPSTELLVDWFKEHGFANTLFAPDIPTAHTRVAHTSVEHKNFDLLIFENLRFFKEEQTLSVPFAKQLATLGTYFVQDAFGTLHRNHTSITLLPEQFAPNKRSIGLLVEKELTHLTPLLANPQQPYIALLGGSKVATKLPLLNGLLPHIKTVMIAPPLCFTFLKALNKSIGRSVFEPTMLQNALDLLQRAEENYIRVLLPEDFLATDTSFEHPESCYSVTELGPDEVGVSIGPRTTEHWGRLLASARTVFCNGLPGNREYPETLTTTKQLLEALPRKQTCVVAGGDTVALVKQLHVGIDGFLSSGGGATLALLSGELLPGLASFR